jgi:hypothetical protein
LSKSANNRPRIIGAILLEFGIASIAFSIYDSSQTIAFIGLGLTFWGALFLLVSPRRFVRSDFLVSAVSPEYSNFDRIISYLGKAEIAYYIPSYIGTNAIPEHLRGLKDPVVFVSVNKIDLQNLPIEDISLGKFLASDSLGALLTPPGLDLWNRLNEKMKLNLRAGDLGEVCKSLPRIILEDFALAKDLTITVDAQNVHSSIVDSVYKDIYAPETGAKSVRFLGCPITSTIACLLAQVSGKTVTITETKTSPDGQTTETTYRILE